MLQAYQTSRAWIGRPVARCFPWATSVLLLGFLDRPIAANDPQAVQRYRQEVQPILCLSTEL